MALMDNIDRRLKQFGIILLVLIVGWWILLFATKDSGQVASDNSTNPPSIIEPEKISFPEKAMSDNQEVNNFVIAFANDLLLGDYKGYRAKVTQRREPINQNAFNEGFGRIENIQIKEIIKTDDRQMLKEKKLADVELPVYRVMIHVDFKHTTPRDVELWIFKEQGHWVSSN